MIDNAVTLHRRNPRRDDNETWLVEYLTAAGCLVVRISGRGVPDLLVGYRRKWLLVEVKNPARKAKLGPAQVVFHQAAAAMQLPCYVIYTAQDAKRMLKVHG